MNNPRAQETDPPVIIRATVENMDEVVEDIEIPRAVWDALTPAQRRALDDRSVDEFLAGALDDVETRLAELHATVEAPRTRPVPFVGGAWHASVRPIELVGGDLPATITDLTTGAQYILRSMQMARRRFDTGATVGTWELHMYMESQVQPQDSGQMTMDAAMQIVVMLYGQETKPPAGPLDNGHRETPSGLIIPGR